MNIGNVNRNKSGQDVKISFKSAMIATILTLINLSLSLFFSLSSCLLFLVRARLIFKGKRTNIASYLFISSSLFIAVTFLFRFKPATFFLLTRSVRRFRNMYQTLPQIVPKQHHLACLSHGIESLLDQIRNQGETLDEPPMHCCPSVIDPLRTALECAT